MKTIVFLCDGMADYPTEALGGKTPLDVSRHPNMDFLARNGLFGLTTTVPAGMSPGSDNANLSVFGYDPEQYYTGRSPLEAVSMGISLGPDDVAYRCNTVTLSGSGPLESRLMEDYSAGEIPSADSHPLVESIARRFGSDRVQLYPGISYRHCLVLRNAKTGAVTVPPHDLTGKPVAGHLPSGENGALLREITEYSFSALREHPVNLRRRGEGKPTADCLWFWGEGRAPSLPSFREVYGVEKGGVISAVDLIRGIGLCAGLEVLPVDGVIDGTYQTDFDAKARAAVRAFQNGHSFVYLHMEGPDECGHHGQVREKVQCIEDIDRKVIGPVLRWLQQSGEAFSVLVMPDHPTPLELRTHVSDPVPFALYSTRRPETTACGGYSEAEAKKTGLYLPRAFELMKKLLA